MENNLDPKMEEAKIPVAGTDVNRAGSPAVGGNSNPTFEQTPKNMAYKPGLGDELRQSGMGTTYPKQGNELSMEAKYSYPKDGNFVAKGSPASAYPKVGNELPYSTDTSKYKKG